MKPSKWLLAAIRALAASILGQTASAQVCTAKGEEFCGLPCKIERCLRVRYGGGVSMNFGLASRDHFLRHWARTQKTIVTTLRDFINFLGKPL